MDPGPTITVVSTGGRSRAAQLLEITTRARERSQPVRVRIPVTVYNYDDKHGYSYLSDAVWNLQLPAGDETPQQMEELIETIGACLVAIAREGSAAVKAKVEGA